MTEKAEDGLKFGPIGRGAAHLCIDMQRIFAEATLWQTPWLPRILPQVAEISSRHAPRTFFTRFIPPESPDHAKGHWRRYYEKWSMMTLERMPREMCDLVPELRGFAPPARIVDKCVYSPWMGTSLHRTLQEEGVDTLVVTGGETDVCVLAAVTGAVDLGYRVIITTDAVCSSCDETHDATLEIYRSRYGVQIETAAAETVLRHWNVS